MVAIALSRKAKPDFGLSRHLRVVCSLLVAWSLTITKKVLQLSSLFLLMRLPCPHPTPWVSRPQIGAEDDSALNPAVNLITADRDFDGWSRMSDEARLITQISDRLKKSIATV